MQHKISLYKIGIITGIVVMSLTACKTKKPTAKILPPEKTAFYTLEAIRDTVKNITNFTLLKITIADTKINYLPEVDKVKNPNALKIEVTDKYKTITAYTDHPLFKKFDLYGDSGEITSKLISLPKAQITFRVPYFAEYNTIKITETVNFKMSNPITLKHEK